VVLPVANAAFTSGQVILSNSMSWEFFEFAAACAGAYGSMIVIAMAIAMAIVNAGTNARAER